MGGDAEGLGWTWKPAFLASVQVMQTELMILPGGYLAGLSHLGLGVLMYAHNPSTRKAEAGDCHILGQPGMQLFHSL